METFTQAPMDLPTLEMYDESTTFLKERLPEQLRSPQVAIVCGSGLGLLAEAVEENEQPSVAFEYESIPHFLRSTVESHAGKLVFGLLGGKPVVLMSGRSHFYEGYTIERITYPVRVFKMLGVQTIVVTNAAGGLNPDYAVGDIVILSDHIFFAGLTGNHPLRGPNIDSFGARFPPLSDAYDLALRRAAHAGWKKCEKRNSKRGLHEGVYAFVGGPSFETRAECRMLRLVGADLVGMSTVPEIVVARHCGIRVLALSLVTNKAVLDAGPRGDDPLLEGATSADLKMIIEKGRANHEEVVEEGHHAARDFQSLVTQIVADSL